MEYVYLIKDNVSGLTKIGYSQKPMQRFMSLKRRANKLETVRVFAGNINDEQAVHAIFSKKRINGEWFSIDDSDLLVIENYFSSKPACAAILKTWGTTKIAAELEIKANKKKNTNQPSRGAIAAAARKLGRHRQSVYRSFKAGAPEVLVAVAKEDLRIKNKQKDLKQKFESIRQMASAQ